MRQPGRLAEDFPPPRPLPPAPTLSPTVSPLRAPPPPPPPPLFCSVLCATPLASFSSPLLRPTLFTSAAPLFSLSTLPLLSALPPLPALNLCLMNPSSLTTPCASCPLSLSRAALLFGDPIWDEFNERDGYPTPSPSAPPLQQRLGLDDVAAPTAGDMDLPIAPERSEPNPHGVRDFGRGVWAFRVSRTFTSGGRDLHTIHAQTIMPPMRPRCVAAVHIQRFSGGVYPKRLHGRDAPRGPV